MKVLNKVLKVVAVISWLLTIAQPAFLAFIKSRYALDATGAPSIGIIGGSDGPTAFFVATNTSGLRHDFLMLCPYIAVISTVILLIKRVRRKHTV